VSNSCFVAIGAVDGDVAVTMNSVSYSARSALSVGSVLLGDASPDFELSSLA
jgi:hypothetical protein